MGGSKNKILKIQITKGLWMGKKRQEVLIEASAVSQRTLYGEFI